MEEAVKIDIPTLASAIVGLFSLIGAVIYGLKKKGLVTLGKPVERRTCQMKPCDEHEGMVKKHEHLVSEVEDIKQNQGAIYDKLNRIDVNVSSIVGYIQGKDGIKV